MPLGRKVADIYAELNLDKDTLRQAMAAAGGEMGADADRIGRQLGDRMSQGMAGQVEQLSARVAKARLSEQKATDAVALAQARLTEAEGKGNVEGSRLLALQQKLSQAESVLAVAHDNTAKATTRHADAEKRLAADLENLGKETGPAADRAGQDAGDKLSQGIHLAIIRNSPLIVAGVSAALAAGAPVMLAGATGLFAGIGILAAAQSDKVQAAWTGAWHEISAGTQADAAVIEPVLIGLATRVTAGFEEMRPALRSIFADAAPQIAVFGDGVLELAERALPGFQRAVANSMPVTQGLRDLLAETGTGITNMLDGISGHAPAAGAVLTDLGQSVQSLLGVLGTLMGEGAEVGATVLPLLSTGLSGVDAALNAVGPALPLVVTGIGGFLVANKAAGWLEDMSGKLDTAGAAGGRFSGILQVGSGMLHGWSVMLPALGASLGVVASLWEAQTSTINGWADAMNQGGRAAAQATDEIQAQQTAMNKSVTELTGVGDAWERAKGLWNDGVAQLKGYSSAEDEASQKAKALLAAMDPLSRSQELQRQALNDLNEALDKHGAGSASAEVAERNYKDASDAVTQAEQRQEQAIHGVTQAMLDQADEARAAIDANFALQHAQNQQRDALVQLKDAIKQHGAASVQAHDAQQGYTEAIYRTAEAQATLAADQSGLKKGTEEYDNVLNTQLLVSLQNMRAGLSGPALDAVNGMITQLQSAGVTTEGVGKKLDDLGTKNPKPTIGPVVDNVTPKVDDLGNKLFDLGAAHPVPKADLDAGSLIVNKALATGELTNLGEQRPTPVAGLNPGTLPGTAANLLGQMVNLGNQRPTPVAGLSPGSLPSTMTGLMISLANLAGQRPTPVASAIDNASGVIGRIQSMINGLQNKTVYLNTVHQDIYSGGKNIAAATGGQIDKVIAGAAKRFDVGGKISGPGGGTDDLIPAVTYSGVPLRVSNREWIIPEAPAGRYGDRKMAAIVAGRAVVSLPGTRSGSGGDGAAGADSSGGGVASSMSSGMSVTVQQLHVHVAGNVDFTQPGFAVKIARPVRDAIQKLEASER